MKDDWGLSIEKRTFDVVFSIALLIALLPVLVCIASAVALFLGRPVMFIQRRPGLNGRVFPMLKFRTMTDGKDRQGVLLSDKERLTRLGRFLRSTSLDELPSLFCVLRGDMSLVGPRPLLERYLEVYTPRQATRHAVRPGITGWAQVNGRNAISWEAKFELDVWYVENQSLGLDLKVLAMTLEKVLRRADISADAHVTMPEFLGTESGGKLNEQNHDENSG